MLTMKHAIHENNRIEWAAELATTLLSGIEPRWSHVQSVVEQAYVVGQALNNTDRTTLVAATYLHDIGYAPTIQKTGFHPLDGAIYLRSLGEERLACLVAHHSEACFEAALRGHAPKLADYPREQSVVANALIYCDMTTGPTGQRISFEERIADIFARYGEADLVTHAIRQALPTLSFAVQHTLQLLQQNISVL
jgi:HD superfamily phosphodiesterase